MNLSVFGPNLRRTGSPETFHVHAADCADCRKPVYRDEPPMILEAATKVEVCDSVYGPEEFNCESGENLFDFKFFPCTKGLS
jgi:hypothetical protein